MKVSNISLTKYMFGFLIITLLIVSLFLYTRNPSKATLLTPDHYKVENPPTSLELTEEIPKDKWYRLWGGTSGDYGTSITIDSDNNIIIGGFTYYYGSFSEVFIAKYNASGIQIWSRIWGTPFDDGCNKIAVDNNSIYLSGYTNGYGFGGDALIVKFDTSGNQLWNQTWGGSMQECGTSIAIDNNKDVYLAGYTHTYGINGDVFIVKFNSSGNQLWNQTWGGSEEDRGYDITIDNCNNIYVTGSTCSFGKGNSDAFLLKYNSTGDYLWNQTWGGTGDDVAISITIDYANNSYITGCTESFGLGQSDVMLVKFDDIGNQTWNHTWGGINDDYGRGIVFKKDKCYVTGWTKSYGAGNSDILLVVYDNIGNQLWNWTWGGSNFDSGSNIAVDNENNSYIIGSTDSIGAGAFDILFIKNSPQYPSSSIPGFQIFCTFASLLILIELLLIRPQPKDNIKRKEHR